MPHGSLFPIVATAVLVAVAFPATAHPVVDLKAYCKQLISFYDRYGAGRTENSDGKRNHTRIGAEIDCAEDNEEAAVPTMTDLLQRKRFEVPSPAPETQGASGE